MKALSIQQPWAWLIVNGFKDIENREWYTNHSDILLIHASKRLDVHALRADGMLHTWPQDAGLPPPMPNINEYETGGIVGYATLQKVVTQSDSPWFRGRYGFVLTQRRPVPFIPLRGQLGLFDVPQEVEDQINAIRDERFWNAEMREQYQIAKEWEAYRLQGEEKPWYRG